MRRMRMQRMGMQRLALRRLAAPVAGDDAGQVAVIVAVCLIVIFGLAAIVIDGGALYAERRELQNGADAGVLAVAEDCARGAVPCVLSVAENTAADYADANAVDGASTVEALDLDLVNREVTADLLVEDASSGDNLLAHWLAPVLGIDASEVRASATAVWGPVGGATTLPVTFSKCEFDAATAGGTVYVEPDPVTGDYPPGKGETILFHQGQGFSGNMDEDCTGVAGQDYAGGFGWLDSNDCSATTDAGGWTGGETGVGTPDSKVGCSADYLRDEVFQNVVLIPVYDATNDLGGSNAEYHIAGYAGLYVTGYRFSGPPPQSDWHRTSYPGHACTPSSERCLTGYFTTFVTPDALDLDGPDFGAFGVELTG